MAGDKLVQSYPLNLKIIKKVLIFEEKCTFFIKNLCSSRKRNNFANVFSACVNGAVKCRVKYY